MTWENWLNSKRFTLFRTAILQEQLIECIMDHTEVGGNILEAGFGFGTTIELLRDLGYNIRGFDLEPTAVENCQKLYPLLQNNLYVANILSEDAYFGEIDTIIHQGVLEHFSDEDITKILNIQASKSKRIVFDVPNNLSAGLKFKRYGRTYDYGNDYLPQILKRYDSDLMKRVGRSSIFVVEGKK